jgi:peptidylprolyl isomerase/peptidyl-prolyl cis-trans isomerase B (cyclophilin B)
MNRFQKWLPALFGLLIIVLVAIGVTSWLRGTGTNETPQAPVPAPSEFLPPPSASPAPLVSGSPGPMVSPSPGASPVVGASPTPAITQAPVASSGKADLTVDSNGLSKATVVMNTTQGVIKFKFYPQDAPHTVERFIELAQKGFYNGLTFHRAIDNFIIQTGDPTGSGNGGSGQQLKAEFNNRRHIEGAVAMARAPSNPDSADSQFYITLSAQPRLDHNYTVFGQVIEGMDAARKIKVGDKVNSIAIQ